MPGTDDGPTEIFGKSPATHVGFSGQILYGLKAYRAMQHTGIADASGLGWMLNGVDARNQGEGLC